MAKKKKISIESPDTGLTESPFSFLDSTGLPSAPPPKPSTSKAVKVNERLGQGERLEIRREKSGRGGKTVTTIQGFPSYLGETKKSKCWSSSDIFWGHCGIFRGIVAYRGFV